MKKLLLALTLFAIMPLCAMKRKTPFAYKRAKLQYKQDQQLRDEIMQSYWFARNSVNITPILARGANPNTEESKGTPCIFFVDQSSILNALLDYDVNICKSNDSKSTVFHEIALYGSPARMALFLLHAKELKYNIEQILSATDDAQQTPRSIVQKRAPSMFPPLPGELNDTEKLLLIVTDPDKNIPVLFPGIVEQFQQERIAAKLKKTGTKTIHEYLLNREMNGKDRQPKWRS